MRHRVYGKHLGRNKNERTALFRTLVHSLLVSESIETTYGKAKAIKGLVDKIITQAKSPATRSLVSQFLINKKAHTKLMEEILPRVKSRNSGYTSIIKMGKRLGDNSLIVKMSLILEEKASRGEKVSQVPQVEKEEKPRDTLGTLKSRGTSKKGDK